MRFPSEEEARERATRIGAQIALDEMWGADRPDRARGLLAQSVDWQEAAIGGGAEDMLAMMAWACASTPNIAASRVTQVRAWMLEAYRARLQKAAQGGDHG